MNWWKPLLRIKLAQMAPDPRVEPLVQQIKQLLSSLGPSYAPPEHSLDYYRHHISFEQLQQEVAATQRFVQSEKSKLKAPAQPEPEPEQLPPELVDEFGDAVEDVSNGMRTRYIWGSKQEVQQMMQQGLPMNADHDALPQGYHYLHVGDEGWVATIYRDYNRDGPVCEVEITNLPDGFYFINDDPDIMDKTNTPDSGLIVSKQSTIPPQCLRVVSCRDTARVARNYPHILNEFPDERM